MVLRLLQNQTVNTDPEREFEFAAHTFKFSVLSFVNPMNSRHGTFSSEYKKTYSLTIFVTLHPSDQKYK